MNWETLKFTRQLGAGASLDGWLSIGPIVAHVVVIIIVIVIVVGIVIVMVAVFGFSILSRLSIKPATHINQHILEVPQLNQDWGIFAWVNESR